MRGALDEPSQRGDAARPATAHLVLQVTGEPEPRVHTVSGASTTLGRTPTNDIVLDLPWVSREQLAIEFVDQRWRISPGSAATTPVLYHGTPLTGPIDLQPVDYFRIPGQDPGELVTCVLVSGPAPAAPASGHIVVALGEVVTIGSDDDNQLGSGSDLLAARHAIITRLESGWAVEDLSGGHTIIDGRPAAAPVTAASERVNAGGLRITLSDEGALAFHDASAPFVSAVRRPREVPEDLIGRVEGDGGVPIEARHLIRTVRSGATLLQDLSLRIRARELVVIVGLSGSGKSTLLNALSGYKPATEGEVLVDGVNLYDNLDHFRSVIGYVPQRDIVHSQLTVAEALDYAARLRLPPTSAEERTERVDAVTADLGLAQRRDLQISRLSGGQLKRVSIGVELISRPELLFLDEPTSGLDPVTETGLMLLLRSLADQGRTVIVITHATKNVMLADRVVFMVPGGRIGWYGPPAEALRYFDSYRDARERADREMEFDEIYRILEDPRLGSPEEWDARFRADPAYRRYISAPLDLRAGPSAAPKSPGKKPGTRPPRPGPIRQLLTLSARNARLLSRDRFALILMLVAAPLLAALDFLITERDMFDSLLGDTPRIVTNTNTLIVNAMLVGALSQMREITKDRDIYQRERLVNLGIAPYVLSKVWVAGLLALYQAIWWTGIRYIAVDMPGGLETAGGIYFTLVLVTLAGMMLGLFASAIAPSEDSVALIVALLIVPQVLFSGAHLPVHQMNPVVRQQMAIMPSRWAFEALITLGGHGEEVAHDSCWQLSEEERAALSPEARASCVCLGPNILTECDFPGIQAFAPPADAPDREGSLAAAVTRAEGRLEVDFDSYGPVYDVNVASRWLALLAICGGLVVIILIIQRAKDRL